jgi:hypothetical protein
MTENLHVPGAKADSGKITPRLLAEDFPHAMQVLYSLPVAGGTTPEAMLRALMTAPADGVLLIDSVKRLLSALIYRDPHTPPPAARANALMAAADVAGFGMRKYTASGWKYVENRAVRYTEAMYRHLLSLVGGQECDLDSGRPHTSHLIWNCMAVLEILALEDANRQRLY